MCTWPSRLLKAALPVALVLGSAGIGRSGIEAGAPDILRETSRTFSAVARKAIPAVVFIQSERTVQVRGPRQPEYYFNDPFGFFGDEFFERFFGGRGSQPRGYRQTAQGSGFLISEDGYILTNNHVVGDADKITVTLSDGREFEAKRVGTDPKSEVAVIRIEGEDFPCIELGNSSDLEIGEWVIAVGNPFGLTETLTVGVVSAKGRSNIGIAEYEDFIQTDAAINPGNSGGPLLNLDGRAVGINTAIYSQSGGYMGIGFAIPIDMAKLIKDQLIAGGSVTRGYLGIQLNRGEVDEDLAASFGLDEARGVLVAEVVPDSPAAEAGLRNGDIILELAGEPVENNSTFRNRVAMIAPGTTVGLTVFRDGEEIELDVAIGTYPGEEAADEDAAAAVEELGLEVRDLTADLAQRFGYGLNDGVLVVRVEPGSRAFEAGIQPGHLIASVNREPVTDVDAFYRMVRAAAGAGRVLLRVESRNYSWYALIRLD
ncbi:MAG: DegQ family serine endoprotease [Lentisphaerae bacterium]|nr:DegQ family serine endoprotease [Lentisphaerota bacterium]